MSVINGIITKGIGGFYYVETSQGVFECKARGKFRKDGTSPLAGDNVEIELSETGFPAITKIFERKNFLIRPPVANLDRLLIVASTCRPVPNAFVTDKLIALAENSSIEPVILISKADIKDDDSFYNIYKSAGFTVIKIDYADSGCIDRIKSIMSSGISALAGNSGVGKSTLLNAVYPELEQKTDDISEKLGRGKHTTRNVELFNLPFGGKIADTPGFSSLELDYVTPVYKDDLPFCFREFADYLGKCRFTSCSHTVEKGCAILEAVQNGEIPKSRHDSYVTMYEQVKNIKEWEKQQ